MLTNVGVCKVLLDYQRYLLTSTKALSAMFTPKCSATWDGIAWINRCQFCLTLVCQVLCDICVCVHCSAVQLMVSPWLSQAHSDDPCVYFSVFSQYPLWPSWGFLALPTVSRFSIPRILKAFPMQALECSHVSLFLSTLKSKVMFSTS